MASEKITALIEEVKNLSVLELSELVKALEEEFGVSAAAMAAPAAGAGAAASCRAAGGKAGGIPGVLPYRLHLRRPVFAEGASHKGQR